MVAINPNYYISEIYPSIIRDLNNAIVCKYLTSYFTTSL